MNLYKLTKDGVSIPSKNMFIPNAEDNRDWQEYQDWLSKGNTPDPADPALEPSYRERRKAEYPPLDDVVDELLTTLDAAGLIVNGTKLRATQDDRNAIKAKYPKPN